MLKALSHHKWRNEKVNETKQKPKCHLCGETLLLDGLKLENKDADIELFLCYKCHDLIKAVVDDSLEEWSVKVKTK